MSTSKTSHQLDESCFVASAQQLAGTIRNLRVIRALSIPLLSQDYRIALLNEAKQYSLRAARDTVGKGVNQVRQDMLLQDQLKSDGLFAHLTRNFQLLFDRAFEHSCYFETQVVFNDLMLQMYEVGSGGITPHRDRTDYRHLICLFVLAGHGRFYISEDRQKSNQIEIVNLPGDVILMPGPGFIGLESRPFHYLEDIREERWVFGLRHDETKLKK